MRLVFILLISLCAFVTHAIETNVVTMQIINIMQCNKENSRITVCCSTNGLSIYTRSELVSALAVGDIVRSEIVRNTQGGHIGKSIRKIGHAPLPPPVEISGNDLAKHLFQPVTIQGVLRSARRDVTNQGWNWLTLRTEAGDIAVSAKEELFPLTELRNKVDAELKLSGFVSPMVTWREGLGLSLHLMKEYEQRTLVPPPPDFTRIPAYADMTTPHRQRLRGRVYAVTSGRLCLCAREMYSCEVIVAAGQPMATVGDSVEIAGFFTPAINGAIASESLVRIIRRGNPVAARPTRIGIQDLFSNHLGEYCLSLKYYHALVSLPGLVRSISFGPENQKTILLGDDRRTVLVDVSEMPPDALAGLRVGCELEATGFCEADFYRNGADPIDLQFRAFVIRPRSESDLRILAQPSPWTPQVLFSIIGVLIAALVGITIWNRSLSTLSKRRGELLYRERFSVERAKLKIEERTRLAVELHDALSQNLTGVSLQLDAVRRFDEDRERRSRHLDIATRTLKSCRNELRNCLWDLRNHALEEPDMNTAIRRTISPFIGDAKLIIRFNVPRERLSDDTAHALMRILRELATNAVKHGHAATIRIAGALENGQLLFSVKDDGDGFDPQSRPGVNDGHFGLEGIRERISRLHGHMELKSSLRQGTTVTISLMA